MLTLITCPTWKAAPPKEPIQMCPQAMRIIFHHTASHHAEITNPAGESVEEAMRYARDIQHFHQYIRGWNDSGHNFLVCRNGYVLQGRWLTVSAIQQGRMVVSAHCPGQNTQIGIEHEHDGLEQMTVVQMEASAQLQAWIAKKYGKLKALPVDPHSQYFNTACPANLKADIAGIRKRAQQIIDGEV